MVNQAIANIFYMWADILEINGVAWKPQAYRRAARYLESMSQSLEDIYSQGGVEALETLPGIGENFARKIKEYILTGKIKSFAEAVSGLPRELPLLMQIESLGPKKIKVLYQKLKIDTLAKLKSAISQHKIAELSGFGAKSEQNIAEGLELLSLASERVFLSRALDVGEQIVQSLRQQSFIQKAELAGSARRRRETIHDLDVIVATQEPKHAVDFFTNMREVKRVLAKGNAKATVILNNNLQVDLRVFPLSQWGSGLLYLTGSKEHNIELRKLAISKGWKISEYGLFSRETNKVLASKTEEELYKKLGLQYVLPELRENRGEIELASRNKLPKLIELKDLQGDLHMHTESSDGANTIREIALACKRNHLKYCAITDHTNATHVASKLDETALAKQAHEIGKISVSGFKILRGVECDILKQGKLALTNKCLNEMDIVIGAVHSGFKADESETTKRICNALNSGMINILAHPTGRLINKRLPYRVNMREVFECARQNHVALEINSQPDRLDLDDVLAKSAVEHGCKLVISTDAHSTGQLSYLKYGVYVARRAWATKSSIVNTLPLNKLMSWFRK